MVESAIKEAFGISEEVEIHKLSTGLINHTYKLAEKNGKEFLLQKINTQIFPKPIDIQTNYIKIQQHLNDKDSFKLPGIILANGEDLIFDYNNVVWRCFEFIPDTYSPATSSNAEEAWKVANCFGKFSANLFDLNSKSLAVILPGFHNLALRFAQFEASLQSTSDIRLNNGKPLIEAAYRYKSLVDFYNKIVLDSSRFKQYILHQDCKIANILFMKSTNEIYSPIDLDTTQSGLYFSDLGDMIRSIVPNLSENDIHFDDLILRADFYAAVKDGYLEAMQQFLTKEEIENIDISGKIVVYMQALRFLADYLNGDIYYHTNYPEQNKDRAKNQFVLLSLLNNYTQKLSDNKKVYLNGL